MMTAMTKEKFATILLIVGGVNWGLVAFMDKDIFGLLAERGIVLPMEDKIEYKRIVYFLVFLAAVYVACDM
mgnify:CR=1 FL=1